MKKQKQVVVQLNLLSNLSINEKIKWIEELRYEDFEIKDYNYHPILRAIMK